MSLILETSSGTPVVQQLWCLHWIHLKRKGRNQDINSIVFFFNQKLGGVQSLGSQSCWKRSHFQYEKALNAWIYNFCMTTMCQAVFYILRVQVKSKCIPLQSLHSSTPKPAHHALFFFSIEGFNLLTHHKIYLFLIVIVSYWDKGTMEDVFLCLK